MISPQFGECKYEHKVGRKLKLILYWTRDSVTIFKETNNLLINSNQFIINKISMSDVIVEVNHDQGVFRFPMKVLFIVKSEKSFNI